MEPGPPPPPPHRSAGVLLHPTSLPGPFGIGDLGPAAYAWVEALAAAGQTWWQLLPLGPTGFGNSPYQSYSAFAGNELLLSPELMQRDGLLGPDDLHGADFPAERVDYDRVARYKFRLAARAWERFQSGAVPSLGGDFAAFQRAEAGWLDDYALFMALKDVHGGEGWKRWPRVLVARQPAALAQVKRDRADLVGRYAYGQFLFFRQWSALRQHAHVHGIKLIGDVPIFVAPDSADVWARPELFLLDQDRNQTVVAGVPPDYFSADGQLWGNPLYDWSAHQREGYRWWTARLRQMLRQMDLVRLDHFRALAAAWHVPAGSNTARTGRWVAGPADDFLASVRAQLGGLPLIAEDLGDITPDVLALRERFDLPGMRVLQFAFSGPDNLYLPHNHVKNSAVYTGTHDNDTTRGWYAAAPDHERDFFRRYTARSGDDVTWDLIRVAWGSVADYAIVPVQDLLDLPTAARMNRPGVGDGNWAWRMRGDQPIRAALGRLAELTGLYDRRAKPASD